MQAAGQPPPPQYGPQYPDQPQPWGQQQPGWNPPTQYNQAPGWGSPPYKKQNQYASLGTILQKIGSPRGIMVLIGLIVILFTVAGIVLATSETPSSPSSTSSSTTPTTPTEAPAETSSTGTTEPEESTPAQTSQLPTSQATPITAAELISAYTNDANSAMAKYEGNTYAISGTISGTDSSAPPFLYLSDGSAGRLEIQCNFSQGQEVNIAMLEIGQPVKVEGKIGGLRGTMIVVNSPKLVQ